MKEPPYSLAKVFSKGKIVFDMSKPDGTPRKLIDVSIELFGVEIQNWLG
jgi:hypothetical protein